MENIEKCRICLDDGEIPIFGVNDISNDVTEYGNIEIGKDDNLPQYLCEACYTLLEAAILFRKTAKQSDELLKRMDSESGSDDADSKYEGEPYIKREYLELNYSSESELDVFDRLKVEHESEDETTNYNHTIAEADTQTSNDCKDFQIDLLNVKNDEDGCINEADNEMIMIIVSDKDKQKLAQQELENSHMKLDNVDEKTEQKEKTHKKVLPHQKECEVCYSIVLKSAYREHLIGHRQEYKEKCDKKYIKVDCKFCGKKISKSYLKHHMKLHGTPEEQAKRLIECPICKKKFSAYYYTEHVRRIHDKKDYKYNQTSRNVRAEKETQQIPKFYKCPVCDKQVKESEYKVHLARHGGPLKRYICDKCGKVFKHPSAFKTHCLTHGSELKYKCQFCPYRGLHQALLKIHVRTHTGDYNYKCTECPARFITKSNLSKHLQRHKGLCNFKCEECGKGFYTKRDVERHSKNVHVVNKTHICEVCGKGFAHRDNMLAHQLKVHKREIITRGRMPSYLKQEFKHLE